MSIDFNDLKILYLPRILHLFNNYYIKYSKPWKYILYFKQYKDKITN